MAKWEQILDFWFGDYQNTHEYLAERMPFWFQGSAETDRIIRQEFGGLIDDYDRGEFPLEVWKSHPRGFLAAILLFDQFTRNLYRDDAKAYSYDMLGLSLAREFMTKGFHKNLRPFEKLFVYLPFEHSESLRVQHESVRLIESLAEEATEETKFFSEMAIDFARKHLEVIRRFGRYPHRNAALGRQVTEVEQEFLDSREIVF